MSSLQKFTSELVQCMEGLGESSITALTYFQLLSQYLNELGMGEPYYAICNPLMSFLGSSCCR